MIFRIILGILLVVVGYNIHKVTHSSVTMDDVGDIVRALIASYAAINAHYLKALGLACNRLTKSMLYEGRVVSAEKWEEILLREAGEENEEDKHEIT